MGTKTTKHLLTKAVENLLNMKPVSRSLLPADAGAEVYSTSDHKLLMIYTVIASVEGSKEILAEWRKGMEFMSSVQGVTIVQGNTDEQTKLSTLPWVKCLVDCYPDALDKAFFIIRSPFKKLTGDLWGVCLITPAGDFLSMTELAVIEEVTEETLASIFNGGAYKDTVVD